MQDTTVTIESAEEAAQLGGAAAGSEQHSVQIGYRNRTWSTGGCGSAVVQTSHPGAAGGADGDAAEARAKMAGAVGKDGVRAAMAVHGIPEGLAEALLQLGGLGGSGGCDGGLTNEGAAGRHPAE